MPHADHFLSRLDRLNTSDVDTALQLYRDPDLLREIMAAAKVPEVVPRVALSLDHPVSGPFIVVTRDGYFVTCLGKGMHATGLHVITRGQLDAFAEKIETLRERLELGKRFIGNSERPLLQLLRRLAEHPDCIGRQEFLAISAWEPMLAKVFVDFYFAANYEIMTQTPGLCRVRHFKGKSGEESLRQYWSLIHTAGHLIILATMGSGGDYFFEATEDHLATRAAMAWSLTQTASLPFITRGAWAVGRVGKCLLPAYKKALGERAMFSDLLDTIFGLIAIGRRHSGLRAEIVKALHATQTAPHTQTAKLLREARPREFTLACRLGTQMTECADDELEEAFRDQGRTVLGNRGRDLPEELLRDVIRVAPLHDYSNGMGDSKSLANTALLVAATARNAPERFYYPQSLAREWRVRWEPKHTLALLELNKQQQRVLRPPARRQDVPRRNEACPCGSGKKYKRCCGAD